MEAGWLQTIQDWFHLRGGVAVAAILDKTRNLRLVHLIVEIWIIFWQNVVKRDATNRCLNTLACFVLFKNTKWSCYLRVLVKTYPNLCLQVELSTSVVGVHCILKVDECTTLTGEAITSSGQIIKTNNHILRWYSQRTTMSRALDVVSRKHQDTCFSLCFIA